MKVLILGGTGAMGVHLVELLSHRKDVEVLVTSRSQRKNRGNISYIQGNAHDSLFLSSLLAKRFDVIIDFMAYGTEEFAKRYNSILNSCNQYVFLSSSRVYANSKNCITEDSSRLLDIISDKEYLNTDEYALAKSRQENILNNTEFRNWTIIRPYITYDVERLQLGIMEKEAWLYRALHGRTIVFSRDIAEHFTTLTYGFDVARGIEALIGKKETFGKVYNITAPKAIRWGDVLDIYLSVLEDKLGIRPRVLMMEKCWNLNDRIRKFPVIYDRLYDRYFDNTRISSFIDLETFTPPQDGLRFSLEMFLVSPAFRGINWKDEAAKDKLTHEQTSLNEIPSLKSKIVYLLYRYFPD